MNLVIGLFVSLGVCKDDENAREKKKKNSQIALE